MAAQQPDKMRLDKWLWAARFFKTRRLAAEAVSGGKVHLNGQRCKPGKEIQLDSRLQINKDGIEWDITVAALPKQRRPASEAVTFYHEGADSQQRRERQLAELRAARAAMPIHTESKPNKRDRRMIHRFKQKAEQ